MADLQKPFLRHQFTLTQYKNIQDDKIVNLKFFLPDEVINFPELIWSFRFQKFQFFREGSSLFPNSANELNQIKCESHKMRGCTWITSFEIFSNLQKANIKNLQQYDPDSIFYLQKAYFRKCQNYSFSLKTPWKEFDALSEIINLTLNFEEPVIQNLGYFEIKLRGYEPLHVKQEFNRPCLKTAQFFKPSPIPNYSDICYCNNCCSTSVSVKFSN